MEWNREVNAAAPVTIHLDGLGRIVIFAIACMTIVLVGALWVDGTSAVVAIVVGALFFALLTLGSLLIISGGLPSMVNNWQVQKTERIKIARHYDALQTPKRDLLPLMETPATHPASTLPSYVPAVEPGIQREAVLWAMGLYREDGEPDPNKVLLNGKENPGRLKVGAPSAEAKEFLLSRYVLERIKNGYRLAIHRYPTADHLRQLM